MRFVVILIFLAGCVDPDENKLEWTAQNYQSLAQIYCHDEVYRNCLIDHRKAGRIVLDADYRIIEAGKNKMWLADCIIKKYNCRDDIYYSLHPHVPKDKQALFSVLGWTKETFFNPEAQVPPELKRKRKRTVVSFGELRSDYLG